MAKLGGLVELPKARARMADGSKPRRLTVFAEVAAVLALVVAVIGVVVAILAYENDKASDRTAQPAISATSTPSGDGDANSTEKTPLDWHDDIGPVGVIAGTFVFLALSAVIWLVWMPDSDGFSIFLNGLAWVGYLWLVWPTVGWWSVLISLGSWIAAAFVVIWSDT